MDTSWIIDLVEHIRDAAEAAGGGDHSPFLPWGMAGGGLGGDWPGGYRR